jgi:leader peptidase (prepilin peptidase)/N-methyltransferase
MTAAAAIRSHPAWRRIEGRTLAVFAVYLAVAWSALVAPETARLGWLAAAGAVLAVVAATDLSQRRVPNGLIYPAFVGALVTAAAFGSLASALTGGAVGFATFYVFALISRGALGMGDVKLAAYVGALLGVGALAVALAAGMLAASAVALALLVLRRASRKDTLPLAPFLVGPALLMLAAGGGAV